MELHPLCTLFPRLSDVEFSELVAFSGIRSGGLGIATFSISDKYPGYWDFFVCDIPSSQSIKSIKPISGEGVAIVLEQFGGFESWVFTPCDKSNCDTPTISVLEKIELLPRESEVVYFLRAGDFIKIGKATGSPRSRVATLQTGCPYKISVISYMYGGLIEEQALHKRFSAIRAHGEWFRAEKELIEFIESLEVTA